MFIHTLALTLLPFCLAADSGAASAPALLGVRIEFVLFAVTLLGVALFHRHTLLVAALGAVAVIGWRWGVTGFPHGDGLHGLGLHLGHEWVLLANLLLLLTGFELLANHFSNSRLPALLPRYLPSGRWGAAMLIVLVWILSGFLDNIAAAMIGATIAASVFRGNVHIGYLAAIVAASNAGGAGSVLGDTTTTMIWLAGNSPLDVLHAYIGGAAALIILAWFASGQQQRMQPISSDPVDPSLRIDWGSIATVILVLIAAISTNVCINLWGRSIESLAPWIGLSVWLALLLAAPWRRMHIASLPAASKGAAFLLCLVLAASLMPVHELPPASMTTTAGLGVVSAVFDNIPLTALALNQGGYDWGMLAFAVGFGGSMIWFGSSAGVAVASQFPQARSVGAWLRHGWYIPISYTIGLLVMYLLLGWRPAS
ncbi:MAG: citrate transporter [Planctomycetota bacterium]